MAVQRAQRAGVLGHADDAAEGNALLQLLSDVLGQQERVGIDPLDLHHVDAHLTVGITEGFLNTGAQLFNAAALTANKHAGTSGLEFNFQLIGLAGNQHIADACGAVLLVDELANAVVFLKQDWIGLTGGVPTRAVFLGNPQAQAGWMDLVSHLSVSSGVRWKEPQQC